MDYDYVLIWKDCDTGGEFQIEGSYEYCTAVWSNVRHSFNRVKIVSFEIKDD